MCSDYHLIDSILPPLDFSTLLVLLVFPCVVVASGLCCYSLDPHLYLPIHCHQKCVDGSV